MDNTHTCWDITMPNKLLFPCILQHTPHTLLIRPHTCVQTSPWGYRPPHSPSTLCHAPPALPVLPVKPVSWEASPLSDLLLRVNQEGEDPTPQPTPIPHSPTTTPAFQRSFTSPSTLHICLHLSSSSAATRRQVRLAETLFSNQAVDGLICPRFPQVDGADTRQSTL